MNFVKTVNEYQQNKVVCVVRRLLVSLVAVLLIACQHHSQHVFPTLDPLGKQQILVTFDSGSSRVFLPGGSSRSYRGGSDWAVPLAMQSTITNLEIEFSLQKQKIWAMESIKRHCVVFAVDAHQNLDELIEKIGAKRGVVTAQVMNQFETMLTDIASEESQRQATSLYNDTHLDLQYGKHAKTLANLHSFGRGHSIKVGVIDTLSDQSHPDLVDQINRQYRYVSTMKTNETHGTAMAGIISARANNNLGLVGLAPDSILNIYAACESVQGQKARCNSFNVLQALEQAIKDDVHVLNLSLAGPYDELIEEVLTVAHNQGMILVAAKNSKEQSKSFPASMGEVVGVGADSGGLNSGDNIAEEDLFGDWLSRPEKLSTLSGGGYRFFTGSSISTASMSGVAVLLREHHSAVETRDYIQALAKGNCVYLSGMSDKNVPGFLQKSSTCRASQSAQTELE